jgi:hypothetical protein
MLTPKLVAASVALMLLFIPGFLKVNCSDRTQSPSPGCSRRDT